MMLLTGQLLIFALVALVVDSKVLTEINCSTKQGSQPVRQVLTYTDSQTKTTTKPPVTFAQFIRSTVTQTITKTETTTSTSVATITTTDSTVTDTFSTTLTNTATTTTYFTNTITETDTIYPTTVTSTSSSTSTVAAPAGFLPIQDTTASAYPQRKRDLKHRLSKPAADGLYKKSYPREVGCKNTVVIQSTRTRYVQQRPTTTTVYGSTITSTVVVTSTSTSTVVPSDVTVTTTLYTTTTATESQTSTTTTTTTDTETATATVAANQYYTACGPSNIIGPAYNGKGLYNVYNRGYGAATEYTYTSAVSAYDCCVQCLLENTGTCSGTVFFNDGGNTCLLLTPTDTTCTSQGSNSGFYVDDASVQPGSFIVSNGPCGYLYDAGNSDGGQ